MRQVNRAKRENVLKFFLGIFGVFIFVYSLVHVIKTRVSNFIVSDSNTQSHIKNVEYDSEGWITSISTNSKRHKFNRGKLLN